MKDDPTISNNNGGVKKENDDENNQRQDRWMRDQLSLGNDGADGTGICDGGLSLETLLRFNTVKSITTNKLLLARAAKSDDLRDLLIYDEDGGTVRRATPFDYGTMGDGSRLSLYVKNVPVTKPPSTPPVVDGGGAGVKVEEKEEEKEEEEEGGQEVAVKKEEDEEEGEEEKRDEKEVRVKEEEGTEAVVAALSAKGDEFRPRYDVTRDEVKALFEPYGRVALVQLRYGKKHNKQQSSGIDEKYASSNARGGGGETYPLGVAIVEFETMDGIERACEELLIKKRKNGEGGGDGDDGDVGAAKVLEMKGNALAIERMRPSKFFKNQSSGGNKKRSRDDDDDADDDADGDDGAKDDGAKFEPITLDWEKGCVISLVGLDAASCDRESIRDAVSDVLGVTNDVRTSGLYVDYNRGDLFGNIRLKSPKPNEMNDVVTRLNDGTLLIANAKVGTARILDGDEEEKYYEKFIAWLNNRKRMKDEERRSSSGGGNHRNGNKRQNFGGGRGGGGGRGRGGRGRGRR